MLWHISKWLLPLSLSLHSLPEAQGDFSLTFTVRPPEVKLTKAWGGGGGPVTRVFNSHWASSNLSVTIYFLSWHWFLRGFYWWVFATIGCDSLCLPVCLSSFWGSGLPCNHTTMLNKKSWFFSSTFYLLGWCADFQASWILDQKPEIPLLCLLAGILCKEKLSSTSFSLKYHYGLILVWGSFTVSFIFMAWPIHLWVHCCFLEQNVPKSPFSLPQTWSQLFI